MFVKPPLPARERVGRGVRRDLASPGPAPQGGSSPLLKEWGVEQVSLSSVSVRIEAATEATAELRDALAVLLPQLNPSLPIPSLDHLAAVLGDLAVTLLAPRDGPLIVGTAAGVAYVTPIRG